MHMEFLYVWVWGCGGICKSIWYLCSMRMKFTSDNISNYFSISISGLCFAGRVQFPRPTILVWRTPGGPTKVAPVKPPLIIFIPSLLSIPTFNITDLVKIDGNKDFLEVTWLLCFVFDTRRKSITKATTVLLIPVMLSFVFSQCISCFEHLYTKITGDRVPSNVICLNVAHNLRHTSFLSTHLAYPCSSTLCSVRISVFTERNHWPHLLI